MNLASLIDHTILKAEASRTDVDRVIAEAKAHRFASICVNGIFISHVAGALTDTGIDTCGVVGFPLGAMKSSVTAIEATVACKDGATEIDFVAHLPTLLACDSDAARAQFMDIVKAARAVNPQVVIKVIIESAVLMAGVDQAEAERRIATACLAARQAGCDFVKTSTGFHPAGGAGVEAVRLMKKHAGPLKVKASGGIRTRDDALRMVDAGADRLGCSASVAIVTAQDGAA